MDRHRRFRLPAPGAGDPRRIRYRLPGGGGLPQLLLGQQAPAGRPWGSGNNQGWISLKARKPWRLPPYSTKAACRARLDPRHLGKIDVALERPLATRPRTSNSSRPWYPSRMTTLVSSGCVGVDQHALGHVEGNSGALRRGARPPSGGGFEVSEAMVPCSTSGMTEFSPATGSLWGDSGHGGRTGSYRDGGHARSRAWRQLTKQRSASSSPPPVRRQRRCRVSGMVGSQPDKTKKAEP